MWGRRRNPSTWALLSPVAATGLPVWLYRGYTGHEHLDQFGLINMNGRMYDPVLGRMLSPDNFIPDPLFSQDYNRYTYARNNPLVYVDPDGNFVITAAVILGVVKAIGIGAAIGGVSYTASIGLSDGGFNNWNWGQFGKSVGIGAISGAVSFGVGSVASAIGGAGGFAVQTAGHAAWGGLNSMMNGGSFWSGAATGAVSNMVAGMTSGLGAGVQIGSSALMGGIISDATGGNFWQGAAVGGVVVGANHLMHHLDYLKNTTKEFREQIRETRKFFSEMRKAFNSLPLKKHEIEIMKLDFFKEQVKTNGPYDLKNGAYHAKTIGDESIYNGETWQPQDYGNYNFGVAAKAFGLPLLLSKVGAGAYQIYSGTSSWRFYRSFFDDPRDARMITRGYNLKWK